MNISVAVVSTFDLKMNIFKIRNIVNCIILKGKSFQFALFNFKIKSTIFEMKVKTLGTLFEYQMIVL